MTTKFRNDVQGTTNMAIFYCDICQHEWVSSKVLKCSQCFPLKEEVTSENNTERRRLAELCGLKEGKFLDLCYVFQDEKYYCRICDWDPFTNIEQAIMVEDKIPEELYEKYLKELGKIIDTGDEDEEIDIDLATSEQIKRIHFELWKFEFKKVHATAEQRSLAALAALDYK